MRFPAGRSSTSTPGLAVVALRLDEPEPPLAAGEERRRDLLEVLDDRLERLGEAPLDRLRELRAQTLELFEALLEILASASCRSASRSFSASYSSFASGLTWPSAPGAPRAARPSPTSSSRSSPSAGSTSPAASSRRVASWVSASIRAISISAARQRGTRVLELLAKAHLGGTQSPQLVTELARPGRSRVDTSSQRCVESGRRALCGRDSVAQGTSGRDEPLESASVDRCAALGKRTTVRRLARGVLASPPSSAAVAAAAARSSSSAASEVSAF